MIRISSNRALLLTAIGLLTSCGQQPAPRQASVPNDIAEARADIEAVKNSPSLSDPKFAGPPIHVDPYPKSAGMSHMHGKGDVGMNMH